MSRIGIIVSTVHTYVKHIKHAIWKHLEFRAFTSELDNALRESVDLKCDCVFVLDWLARIERELDLC